MRKQFATTIFKTLESDPSAVILIGDISHYALSETEKKFPNRFYNMGICEQSLIGFASGMASTGNLPIVHTIAPFCVERAFEQIKIDLCYQELDVTIVSVGSSFDYASLGCTHHCYEDISILRSLPNMQIFVPGSSAEFDYLFRQTWNNGSPKYFKLSAKEHNQTITIDPFEVSLVEKGTGKNLLFVTGHLLEEVINASQEDTIIYVPTLSYLSDRAKKTICDTVLSHENIFTVEENSVIGGLGDEIFNILCEARLKLPTRFEKIGIPHKFLNKYGTADQHRENLGLHAKGIRERVET